MSDRSDPLTDALARFTPTARLDRDEMLFRAGRASAGRARGWKIATGLLAISQALMLIGWLNLDRSPPTPHPVSPPMSVPAETDGPPLPEPYDPQSYIALVRNWEQDGLPPDQPPPVEAGLTRPPLTAADGWRWDDRY